MSNLPDHPVDRTVRQPTRSLSAARWREWFLVVGCVAALAGIAQSSPGHSLLSQVGLLQPPAKYTELSFSHPQSLPQHLGARKATIKVSFVVHNLDGSARAYEWAVLLHQVGGVHRVANGRLRVASGQAAVVTKPVSITCLRGQVQLIVSLKSPAESIDTWTSCHSRRR